MNSLKEIVKALTGTKTIKPKNSYTFTKRTLDLGNGRQASSEYVYLDTANGLSTGDWAPIVGGRTIYYSPEKNDTLYWMNQFPEKMVGYEHGYFPVPDASKDQEKAKSNFYKVIKWAQTTNKDSAAAQRRALQGKKQGGQIENLKFQQGGTVSQQSNSEQDAVMQFVLALAQTLQADPNQIIQYAQANPDALKSAVQVYQLTLDMNQAAQAFAQAIQSQTQAAKHGAKLNYLKALKNKCAEDEELVYYKRGGSVDCGCKKKDGGELKKDEKKESPISKFKAIKKEQNGDKLKKLSDKALRDSISKYRKPYPKGYTSEDKIKHEEKLESFEKELERRKNTIKKDCGGSKLLKKGGKVCPKCGKVHKAGMGCAVSKFKYRKLGGLL